MLNDQVEIAICGAGPVGQALAMLLINQGMPAGRIALIDAKTEEQANADVRTIALSQGSRQILTAASGWPVSATEIHQIHVSRRGHFGRTVIDRTEHHVPALGYVARYADIIAPLSRALSQTGVLFLRPAKVTDIEQQAEHVLINLDYQTQDPVKNRPQLKAALVVQAEGGLFGEQTGQARQHDYQQTGLIAHVQTSAPVPGRAYERFTDQGPLALLPQENGYALVWCVRPEHARTLQALDTPAFLTELQKAFGERLGQFTHATPRHAFPLGLSSQTSAPAGRCIKIGNAAQILHPVAGQGLNLGLRDAFQLAKSLRIQCNPAGLRAFYEARKADRHTTITLTDSMARLFASSPDGSATQILSGLALGYTDVCPPMQRLLARQMMYGLR